ncbi:hypothetical protein I314_06249 [Cryptococcus bacillisporus CA1873]|uniref:Unplaced genomic scaffold supercont1.40, whole genome shotgun sequence n=2 Tax=Cryptococcus gattii TaxID=552467 RepID=A0A0D0U7H6_CRYGA|nr:hypothetical protein I312_06630 [Cryptococcus bacillisporus CA1280]KIR57987.1 hypothetical protein I314_06249 [Cryptococcus bacillisporus CA1873]|eukprot:KIR57987.1 hypothetical protein I314_06249 [Cryptococcus gattii CA1873]
MNSTGWKEQPTRKEGRWREQARIDLQGRRSGIRSGCQDAW